MNPQQQEGAAMNVSAISHYTRNWSQVGVLGQSYGDDTSGMRETGIQQAARSQQSAQALPLGGFQELLLGAMESFNNSATIRTERRKDKSYTNYY